MKNKKPCLVVIDMINGFVFEGSLSDQSIDKISGNIESLIQSFIELGYPIINFRDSHPKNANEFNAFPSHCIENTSESELINQLKPYEKSMITLLKNSTNGFMQPEFLDLFKSLDCDEYICVGCCTDICVLQFALSLQSYINQHDLAVHVAVVDDSVETFSSPGHDQKEYGQMALSLMQGAGVRRISSFKELIHDQ